MKKPVPGHAGQHAKDNIDAAPSSRPFFGITLTITASIMLIVAVSITAVAWQQWTAANRNTEELAHRNGILAIGRIDAYLDQFLRPAAAYVKQMANVAVAAGWHREDSTIGGGVMEASVAAAPEIVNSGMMFYSGLDFRFDRFADDTRHRIYHRANTPYYENLRALLAGANEPTWSPPAFDTVLNSSILQVWHAVRDDDQYAGAWYASVSLAAISEAVTEVGDGMNGFAFVIRGKDHVLAHANLMSRHPEQSGISPTVRIGRVGDLVLDGIWQQAKKTGVSEDLSSDLTTVSATIDGKDYVGFFREIFRYEAVPWTLGIWFEKTDVNLYDERLVIAAWFAVAMIILALITSVYAGRAISRPIRHTAQAVTAISHADMDGTTDLPPSRIREINDLAFAFNSMRAALKVFETYVPRSLVRRLTSRDDSFVVSSERQMTVMFTDIVGFTTIAEGKSATEVAELVNEHFEILGACVEEHGGTIDKYIGDALMAFWGAPEEIEDASSAACYCAMAMVDALERDNYRRRKDGLPPIRIRIGIHTGTALVGNIGAKGRVNYTIIGDTVNTCQRIESLGREIDSSSTATIVISDTVAKQLPASMPYMHVGSFAVKGRESNVEAYRLMT